MLYIYADYEQIRNLNLYIILKQGKGAVNYPQQIAAIAQN
jgi:hypothetical protein